VEPLSFSQIRFSTNIFSWLQRFVRDWQQLLWFAYRQRPTYKKIKDGYRRWLALQWQLTLQEFREVREAYFQWRVRRCAEYVVRNQYRRGRPPQMEDIYPGMPKEEWMKIATHCKLLIEQK